MLKFMSNQRPGVWKRYLVFFTWARSCVIPSVTWRGESLENCCGTVMDVTPLKRNMVLLFQLVDPDQTRATSSIFLCRTYPREPFTQVNMVIDEDFHHQVLMKMWRKHVCLSRWYDGYIL